MMAEVIPRIVAAKRRRSRRPVRICIQAQFDYLYGCPFIKTQDTGPIAFTSTANSFIGNAVIKTLTKTEQKLRNWNFFLVLRFAV